MATIEDKFKALATENAPGQEVRQKSEDIAQVMRGDAIEGRLVDFSHGDVDAFAPPPGAKEAFDSGVRAGGAQAYTEYRGAADIRRDLAEKLANFTGAPIAWDDELIITPGTQGALFLALAATVSDGDKVVIIEPDYFANRKLVRFFGGIVMPVKLNYLENERAAGLDLTQLRSALEQGAKVMVFSNPNNPTGVVYSNDEISAITALAEEFNITVIVDQLYSRLLYAGSDYFHFRSSTTLKNVITIMGPSKTESLSGFRLGAAFGSAQIIERMEKLQAIVSLRAAGYNQAVLHTWFSEPDGWMAERVRQHQAIRDDLLKVFRAAGFRVSPPQAGSYLFPYLPEMEVEPQEFVKLLRHQANVIVTPGSEFDPNATRSIRLNFSQDHSAAVAAAERITELAQRYRR